MPAQEQWEVLVRRDNLAACEIRVPASGALRLGELRLAIEKFGLTTNNVTYAHFGDGNVPFWNAFPAPPGFGRVPLWSFVRVADSRHPDIPVGSRYFGYVPMASQHTVRAEVTARGFQDVSPQRAFLPPWYLTFQQVDEPDEWDDVRALLRPVFPASFNLADLVERQVALGAKSLIITSASCKTAIGMADELLARGVGIATVAITATGHQAFVEGLGIYDQVTTYDAIGSATVTSPAVFIDFTGAAKWLRTVYRHFAPSLSHGVLIGLTHPDAGDQAPAGLPDPQPEFFFTPMIEDQAIAEEGADAYFSRYHAAETRFLRRMAAWLTIRAGHGPSELVDTFRSLVVGTQPPDVSRILTP